MPIMSSLLDILSVPVLYADHAGLVIAHGHDTPYHAMPAQVKQLAQKNPILLCHRQWTEDKIGFKIPKPLDVLELFAFIRPAQFCLPTPAGIAKRLGLPMPTNAQEKADSLAKSVRLLLEEAGHLHAQDKAADIADMMGRGGWLWAEPLLARWGRPLAVHTPPDARAAEIWKDLSEYGDYAPRAAPGIEPVVPDEARKRLADILGAQAEIRQTQSDYAASMASIFASPDKTRQPLFLLAEAGTGTGKTLGYLAPASLWAEANDAPVWVSTYTRTLQHQIADELSRFYPDRQEARKKIVIRKGRENYLCLLNLEEAVHKLPMHPQEAVALGLMARWAAYSPDGDLTGSHFPAWLIDLIGRRLSVGLSDRRGECIHSACPHYQKCFVEKSSRKARFADIVIANHALVMIQTAMSDTHSKHSPTRLIFDEGHHVFDAADSAFSAALTAMETAELRRWIRGAEEGKTARIRGLALRLSELLGHNHKALTMLDEAVEAAGFLPDAGWRKRLSNNHPAGPAETFFAVLRVLTYQRASKRDLNTERFYDLQAPLYPVPDEMLAVASVFAEKLTMLSKPLTQLAAILQEILDDEADTLDSQMRNRFEGVARGLLMRASGPVAAWADMLGDLKGEGREGFVDWMQIDRRDTQDIDIGLRRHWLDPSQAFAKYVLASMHGVAITSATLRDETLKEEVEDKHLHEEGMVIDEESWRAARHTLGAAHLPHPAFLSQHESPFDYKQQTRIFIVNDLSRDRIEGVAAAMASLMTAIEGGALGLFTSIQRLKQAYPHLRKRMHKADIPIYAQHVEAMNLATLLQLFREEPHSVLIGTDAVRDGVDVPGKALQMIIYDRVPWPRPDMLFKARCQWHGRDAWTDRATRMKLRQAFGRLIRRRDDRGVFIMLDSRLPTRLTSAFPPQAKIIRTGLADTITQSTEFLGRG